MSKYLHLFLPLLVIIMIGRRHSNEISIGTLNCRGIRGELKQKQLAGDIRRYKLQIVAIQETHLQATGAFEISDGTNRYEVFYTGANENRYHGVGIIADKNLKGKFKRVSDRICTMTTYVNKKKMVIISAYAPTSSASKKEPRTREEFYETLDATINSESKGTIVVVAGDFNAKTGTGHEIYPEVVGKFGKGEMNENGQQLVDTCYRNELFLTNTTFQHKMAHRTTWVCPERIEPHKNKDGTTRRNPYRNQIDYIIMRKQQRTPDHTAEWKYQQITD